MNSWKLIINYAVAWCFLSAFFVACKNEGAQAIDGWPTEENKVASQCGQNQGVFTEGNTIYYCGLIDAENVVLFENTLQMKHTLISIEAFGGDPIPAINLSRVIMASNLEVQFPGICIATCAQFVFVSQKKPRTTKNTIVGFGHTQSVFSKLRELDGIPTIQGVVARSEAEKEFYNSLGIRKEFLFEPFLNNPPDAVGIDPSINSFDPRAQVGMSRVQFVVPSYAVISKIVPELSSVNWPNDEEDMSDRIKRSGAKISIMYKEKWETHVSQDTVKTCLGVSILNNTQTAFEPQDCFFIPLSNYVEIP